MLAGFDEPERIFQLAHPDLENLLEALRASSVESSSLPLPEDLSTAGRMKFVGRRSDLQQVLAEAWTSAPQSCEGGEGGAATAVWVLGEPGVGKTRFAAEVATMAHQRGALVLFGRCDELVQDPYQPFVQALRWYINQRTTAQLATSLGGDPAPLARLVPELGSRFPSMLADIGGATEVEQHRLFESVLSWLAGLAVGGPVVFVVDDAHWADRPTLAMLAHLLKSAVPTRLLVVGTARDTDPDTNDLLASIIDQLARTGRSRRLRLEGLDAVEVASLISSSKLQVDVPDRLARRIVDQTAGNPLFIGAVLAGLEARGFGDDTGLPGDLVSAVRTRVRRLDPRVQDLLQVAALVGLEFSLLVIAGAHGIAEVDALTGLESAVRAALVDEIAVNRFRFAHALVRDVLFGDVSASRRSRLHASIAASIQRTFAQDLDPHLRSLAYHCAASELSDLQEKAIYFADRAAKQAIHQVAFLAAVDDLSLALEVSDRIGAPVSVRYDLTMAMGEAQALSGLHHACLSTYRARHRTGAATTGLGTVGSSRCQLRRGKLAARVTWSAGPAAPERSRRPSARPRGRDVGRWGACPGTCLLRRGGRRRPSGGRRPAARPCPCRPRGPAPRHRHSHRHSAEEPAGRTRRHARPSARGARPRG